MKKSYKKILTTFISAAFVSFFATGCFDPAFYEINQDVASEDATLSGNIVSIARYTVGETEYLVSYAGETEIGNINTARGVVYKPAANAEYGEWKNLDGLPFELSHYDYYGKQNHLGQQIIKVLADSENIYVVSVEWTTNIGEGTNCPKWVHLWTVKPTDSDNDGTWDALSKSDWEDLNPIPDDADEDDDDYYANANYETSKLPVFEGSDDYYYSAFNVFSTNSPQKANRKVYLRCGVEDGDTELKYRAVSYYEVSPSGFTDYTVPSIIVGTENKTTVYEKDSNDYYYNANAVAIVDGKTIFFGTTTSNNAIAVTTNETYEKDATMFYYSSGSTLYYGSTDTTKVTAENADDIIPLTYNTSDIAVTKVVSAGSWITSLAYCKDAILIGRGGTYAYNSTSSTSSGGIEKVQFTSEDIPSTELGTFTTNAQSQLLTSYIVQMLLNATPDKDELDSILYASLSFTGTASSTTASYSNIGMWAYYPERGNWNREQFFFLKIGVSSIYE